LSSGVGQPCRSWATLP